MKRAWVLRPHFGRAEEIYHEPRLGLEEAVSLAKSIGLEVIRSEIIKLRRRNTSTLFGSGIIDEFAKSVAKTSVDLVIVDSTLTPTQQRNLETAWLCKIIDRTGLILEIFGRRATTHEGRLQVELAALSYQRNRLVRAWTHLERQRGGFGFLGGPGESQIEADRRHIDKRVNQIRKRLARVVRTRDLQRNARSRIPFPTIALVGYTNAGKSTLFNRLTNSDVDAKDEVFATLDPTMRRLVLPSGQSVILSDTVGFIANIPTDLISAFRATLEEVVAADAIIHVRDISHPGHATQNRDVRATLRELGIDIDGAAVVIEAFNKIDRLDSDSSSQSWVQNRGFVPQIMISARDGTGCDQLVDMLDSCLTSNREIIELSLPATEGWALAWLYQHGEVLSRADNDENVWLRVSIDPVRKAQFDQRFAAV